MSAPLPPTGRQPAIWLTWERQPRNRSMARELGIPLYEIVRAGGRLRRQWASARETWRVLRSARPEAVFASNPSLVLTLLLLAWRPLLRYRLASDAHYGGIVAVNGGRVVQIVLDFINRVTDLTIVTTDGHADIVHRLGGTALVCPDPLPDLPDEVILPPALASGGPTVLFICSFDRDEPFADVFEAAESLAADGFRIFVSGRYARVGLSPEGVPHVTLLGYVDSATYDGYLRHVDVVLDLTTWEDCLVCGAYEAMAAGRPAVLSTTSALTRLFTAGTVFTGHAPVEIADAVRRAYAQRAALAAAIPGWTAHHVAQTRERMAAIRAAMNVPSDRL